MSLAVSFSTIVEMFDLITTKFANAEKPFLLRKIEGKYQPISYTEFRENVIHFAHGLTDLGLKAGDHIALLSENRPEWATADLAILSMCAIDVPLYPTLTAKQIEFILNDAGTKAIVLSNAFQLNKVLKIASEVKSLKHIIVMNDKDAVNQSAAISFSSVVERGRQNRALNPDFFTASIKTVKADDICTIIYTSGTTGNPKGVVLTHRNFVSNITSAAQCLPISPSDLLLSFLPLCHVFERMGGYYAAMSCGASIAYAESIDTVAENMLQVKPTIIATVPRLFERIYNKLAKKIEKDPPSRQKIFYWAVDVGRKYMRAKKTGSIPFGLNLKHALADKLVFSKIKARTGGRIRFFASGGAALPRELGEFFEAVGITILEGYGLTETSPVISINRLDGYKFGTVGKIIAGIEVKIASDGEILTRGPHVMKGYYNNRKATEEILDKDGWLHTGDIGTFDGEGFLLITDRKKHLFVSSGGKNIAPQPIENLFSMSKFVDQFVLIGDRRMFLTALIVPDFDAIAEFADKNNIPYKHAFELTKNPEVYKVIENDLMLLQKDLANYERVRRFTLIEKPFSIEGGELTPSMKIKRNVVEERYKELIEDMYKSVA